MALHFPKRRRLFSIAAVLVITVALLGLWAGSTFAASPTTTPTPTTATVAMQGQGTVVEGQLRLKMTSSKAANWLLEMSLNPVGERRSSEENVVYTLQGTFMLGTSDHPLASGSASGTMDQNGNGDIRLTQNGGSVSLDVPFTVQGNSVITAQVKGTWPALPVVQAAPAATTTAAAPVNHFWWYLSRTAGLVAYILLFLSIAAGLTLRTNHASNGRRRFYLEVHKFLAILGLGFIALHILSLLGDSYIGYTPAELFIPVSLPYRPLASAIGILGMYAFVIVMLVFMLRRWLGRKMWRVVHGGAILMFVLVLVHSITAGTDSVVPWVRWMYALTSGATVFLVINYYFRRRSAPQPAPRTSGAVRLQRRDSR